MSLIAVGIHTKTKLNISNVLNARFSVILQRNTT